MFSPISPIANTAVNPYQKVNPYQDVRPMAAPTPVEKFQEQFKVDIGGIKDPQEQACTTCSERRYMDGSNDSGVSFQTPTHISPEQSFSQVRAHEHEHLSRHRAKAAKEGKQIISQSVTYSMSTCPECGKNYKSGGSARTVTKSVEKSEAQKSNHWEEGSGKFVDKYM